MKNNSLIRFFLIFISVLLFLISFSGISEATTLIVPAPYDKLRMMDITVSILILILVLDLIYNLLVIPIINLLKNTYKSNNKSVLISLLLLILVYSFGFKTILSAINHKYSSSSSSGIYYILFLIIMLFIPIALMLLIKLKYKKKYISSNMIIFLSGYNIITSITAILYNPYNVISCYKATCQIDSIQSINQGDVFKTVLSGFLAISIVVLIVMLCMKFCRKQSTNKEASRLLNLISLMFALSLSALVSVVLLLAY